MRSDMADIKLSHPVTDGLTQSGADDGIRTRDLRFTKPLLYQLSYVGAPAGNEDCTASRNRQDSESDR